MAPWRLYDIVRDPYETRDLAARKPRIMRRMIAEWQGYAKRVGVVLPERPWKLAPELIPVAGGLHDR